MLISLLADKIYMLQIGFHLLHGDVSHFHFLSFSLIVQNLLPFLCYQGLSSIIVGLYKRVSLPKFTAFLIEVESS